MNTIHERIARIEEHRREVRRGRRKILYQQLLLAALIIFVLVWAS